MVRGTSGPHNATLCPRIPTIVSTLYLIRHGQASFGTAHYDRLSALGREQVTHLREHLRMLGTAPGILWSGSLRRQIDTAAILAEGSGVQPQTDLAFDEYRAEPLIKAWLARQATGTIAPAVLSAPHSVPAREYQRMLESAGLAWVAGELDDAAPERWPAFRARVTQGLDALLENAGRGRRIALCTSAGVIGAAVGHLLGLDDRQSLRLSWSVRNASVTTVLFDAQRSSVSTFNGLAHLERPGLEQLITYR